MDVYTEQTDLQKQSDQHYLNVTLKNEETASENEVVISLPVILKQCKRYLIAWLLLVIIIGGLITGVSILMYSTSITPVTSLVNFTYSGIESGKNPDGSEFDGNSLKSPTVIAMALKECDMDPQMLESVRQGITIKPIIPSDAMDRLLLYGDLYSKATSGQLSAAQALLDTSWHSTQYQMIFSYSKTSLNREQAAQLLNAITDAYRDYFFEAYGYNDSLGTALKVLDYTNYDYAEAVDLFDNSLTTLRTYVRNLADSDTAKFRSTVTGYSFSDLQQSINTIRELDLDQISSYIAQNNVTKDKDTLQAYYEYRIENLSRQKIVYEETLASIQESISGYEKDSIYIFNDSMNTQSTTASQQYDKMISQKISTQTQLSETAQRIEFYNQRLASLRKSTIGSTDKVKKTEKDLETLHTKITDLVTLVEQTADDYFKNFSLTDAYGVLVPASGSMNQSISDAVSASIKPVLISEIFLFVIYLCVVFFSSLKISNTKKKPETADAEEANAAEETIAPAEDAKPAAEKNDKSEKKKKS